MRTPELRRRRAVPVAVSLLVAAAAVAASYSPIFAARDLRIASPPVPRGEVLALAGIDRGTNVFHLDTGEVERRLEADPRVLEATVTTSLPSSLRIAITPRRPVAVAGSPAALIGADGIAIGPVGSTTSELPILRGDDLRLAASAAAAMSPALRRAVEAIAIRPDGGISVRLEVGFTADLGAPSELPAKAASLAAILRWATAEGVRVVSADVTVPGSPTARLADGETAVPSG
ncbi:MAG TPA: FtsQ-type POTRA domain-containing protein [Actinomycetota bacterium]|nr:FtsQ-type POTRA domain-containing protein [Actinomycetota bacterium]